MFTIEWLPYALLIGIDETQFWSMNPRRLKPYTKAYNMQKQSENTMAYIQGMYFVEALRCTIGNMFSKKSSKPLEYPKEPYRLFEGERDLTEHDIEKQRENLVARLKIMQSNFNNNHKKRDNT